MAKRLSPRLIKSHRTYTYKEAARELGVTPQTVRSWCQCGLDVMNSQKPHLILGSVLKAFLIRRAERKRCSLQDDEFYCLSCKAPRRAYDGLVEYVPIGEAGGRLEAFCDTCGASCTRFVSRASTRTPS